MFKVLYLQQNEIPPHSLGLELEDATEPVLQTLQYAGGRGFAIPSATMQHSEATIVMPFIAIQGRFVFAVRYRSSRCSVNKNTGVCVCGGGGVNLRAHYLPIHGRGSYCACARSATAEHYCKLYLG